MLSDKTVLLHILNHLLETGALSSCQWLEDKIDFISECLEHRELLTAFLKFDCYKSILKRLEVQTKNKE